MPDNSVVGPNAGIRRLYQLQDDWISFLTSLDLIDAILQAGVLDKDLTTPPGSPTDGDRYIVGSGAGGAWAGHDDEIAVWYDVTAAAPTGEWVFIVPKTGWRVDVADEGGLAYRYSGSAWASTASGVTTGILWIDYTRFYGGSAVNARAGFYAFRQYNGDADNDSYATMILPADFGSLVRFDVHFSMNNSNAGNMVWRLGTKKRATTESLATTFNETDNTIAGPTVDVLKIATLTAPSTTGWAAGDEIHLKMTRRAAADTNDVNPDGALLIALVMHYNKA
jgi:hypothetical protein